MVKIGVFAFEKIDNISPMHLHSVNEKSKLDAFWISNKSSNLRIIANQRFKLLNCLGFSKFFIGSFKMLLNESIGISTFNFSGNSQSVFVTISNYLSRAIDTIT